MMTRLCREELSIARTLLNLKERVRKKEVGYHKCCCNDADPWTHLKAHDTMPVAMQATQALACICMALSASIALVFLYFSAVLRCSPEAHSGRYCFQLNFT